MAVIEIRKKAIIVPRSVVASVGSISFNPIFPKMATPAAVIDESAAKIIHIYSKCISMAP